MIEFKNISKIYADGQAAVEDISLTINKGEFVCFIGTSGSGKTTCLRMLNRMIEPSKGEIIINGKPILSLNRVELRRKIGYVIQQIGLMPHLTIYENIVTVPKLLKWDEERQQKIARNLIRKVDLPEEYLERYPSELSGGQQQRIGVIRALAADQNIILMDEPFGALDPITRQSLQQLVKRLQRETGKTFVFVTHDMDEALTLADRIAIMDNGKLIQYDTPENIINNPANKFVEEFLGEDRIEQAKNFHFTVGQSMFRTPVSIYENQTTKQALSLMNSNHVDMLFVTDLSKKLLGVITISDIKRFGRKHLPLKDYIKDCIFVTEDTKIQEATYSILELGLPNLPVVDQEDHLIGLITRGAIVESIYNSIWADEIKENTDFNDVIQTTSEEHKSDAEKINDITEVLQEAVIHKYDS